MAPIPAETKIFCIAAVSGVRELRGSGGSILRFLDRAEDHGRGALD